MVLAEEISRQPRIGSVVWLSVIMLTLVCNGKKQVGQREMQNIQFDERSIRNCDGTKSSAQGEKRFKEKPEAKGKKGSGDFRARSRVAKPQFVKNK